MDGAEDSAEALHPTIDARQGQVVDVFLIAPGRLDGRPVSFSESGGRGVTSWSASGCPAATIEWRRVGPTMSHVSTPAPNRSISIYANAVVFGPRHGTWIGYDRVEYAETPVFKGDAGSATNASASPRVRAGGWVLAMKSAEPAQPSARQRATNVLLFGVMRLSAQISLGSDVFATPGAADAPKGQIADDVFRFTFRQGDDLLGWLTTYFNVPYLFGSAGKGAKSQAERYIGADCADVLVAALRRAGNRSLEYSSVMALMEHLKRVGPTVEIRPCESAGPCQQTGTALRFGPDVRPGDLLALDYIDVADLPRPFDHIVALVADRGPAGTADGVLGPEDLVADSGSAEGLKFAPLSGQGPVRVAVLRTK